jgi:CDGSH iron-sulfur domain-containing protein 3
MKFEHMKDKSHPLKIELKHGSYKWCGCGKTKKVPFCDGTCKGGKAVRFKITEKRKVRICNCGLTKTPPFCDGSCKKLKKK